MKSIYYIAYGSNLNLGKFIERCPSAKLLGTSLLLNKSLVFKGDDEEYSYLTLEEELVSTVPVAIFELSYFDSIRLDKYEGYPMLYSKEWIDLDLAGNSIRAMIYIMRPRYNYYLPSLPYFNSCLRGYDYFGFDKKLLIDAVKRTINYVSNNDDKKSRN